ncbi:A-kinase anchor protein 1, mitochondrial [Elysia marginata]|uniref:A-kinase anchor protein 1, mitochondrial n=1 Tax=Elysia marginata TaxID=1093978 RepID=A0AAV4EKG2_9GAST|nr:A-kinase anchor protein 1, mitochondrial [Elysia marginata]
MRDYRVPLAVAVPAAFALFAVLWILRKKSGKGEKPSGKTDVGVKSDVPLSEQHVEDIIPSSTGGAEKEGITITQRKIPETQARDRGDADLSHEIAPDFIAGQDQTNFVTPESPIRAISVHCEESAALAVVQDAEKFGSEQHNQPLSQIQLDQVERIIMSAMGDGLHEATGKLISSQKQNTEVELDQSLSASSGIEIVESFEQSYQDRLESQVEALPLEKVVTCSSVAIIGFDTEENRSESARSTIEEALISEEAIKPISASVSHCQVETEPDIISEMAAEGTVQCSPQEQAAFFPSTDLHSPISAKTKSPTEDILSVDFAEETPINSNELISSQVQKSKESFVNGPSHVSFSSDLSTPAVTNDQPLYQEEKQKSQERFTDAQNILPMSSSSNESVSATIAARRRMPTMSTGSLESQASLGPEDIDSLWGIKPLSAASANWDRQLSLDDPDSPFRKSANASGSDMSLPSSNPSADTEDGNPSTVLSFSNEQLLAPSTSTAQSQRQTFADATNRMEKSEDSDLPSPPSSSSKEASNVEDRKDNDPPLKPNSPLCDSNSEGSNDSGRGGSEHEAASGYRSEPLIQLDFNIPSDLCGRFIGRHGKNINFMKNKTGANISLTNNPFTAEFQICQVAGTQTEVDSALGMIRRKFPLQDHPLFTMVPININPASVAGSGEQQPFIVPDVMQLSLPEGVSVEVYVSAIVNAGHVFVQQPTHRSFMSLEKLTYHLNNVYGQDPNVPSVPTPVECGVICVVESQGFWYRAMIMSKEDENGETQIKFVDYGGYASMHVSALKQIRTDFMTLPFQAVECFMANITPLQGEEYFSDEAINALSEMTNMKLLQCQVIARSEMGMPYIHLYQINPTMNSAVLINEALASDQHVQWVEMVSQEQETPVVFSTEG